MTQIVSPLIWIWWCTCLYVFLSNMDREDVYHQRILWKWLCTTLKNRYKVYFTLFWITHPEVSQWYGLYEEWLLCPSVSHVTFRATRSCIPTLSSLQTVTFNPQSFQGCTQACRSSNNIWDMWSLVLLSNWRNLESPAMRVSMRNCFDQIDLWICLGG